MKTITAIKSVTYNLDNILSDLDDGSKTKQELFSEATELITEWADEDLNSPYVEIILLDENEEVIK